MPQAYKATSVGCAECHGLRPAAHADTFEHNGYDVHVVVTPDDCAVCHKEERGQFYENIMANAYGNLADNTLYQDLQRTIIGTPQWKDGRLTFSPANAMTRDQACYYCHGTRLKVTTLKTRDTDAGELSFPVIEGWPNQGVGRINPDNSQGACSACHPRHTFSMAMARKPDTCKECHKGPDVPAYKIYEISKHGHIYETTKDTWSFENRPWTAGNDFIAPTCAACHISEVVNTDGEVLVKRTHRISDRLGYRIFGLFYAHPQPKSPDTTIIRNQAQLPLPTNLDGTAAQAYLISSEQIQGRRSTMKQICSACHDSSLIESYFNGLDNSITTTNAAVVTATNLMKAIWDQGYATGMTEGSIFDEYIERVWSDAWLIHANNIRFAAAMAGGGDYGVFEDGSYHLSKAIMELEQHLRLNGMQPTGLKQKK